MSNWEHTYLLIVDYLNWQQTSCHESLAWSLKKSRFFQLMWIFSSWICNKNLWEIAHAETPRICVTLHKCETYIWKQIFQPKWYWGEAEHGFYIFLSLLTRKRFYNSFDWWSLITLQLTLLIFLLTFCHKKCHLSNNLLFCPCFDEVVHTKKMRLLVCLTFPFTLKDSLTAWFRLPPPRRPQLQQRSSALTQPCLRKCNCVHRNPV